MNLILLHRTKHKMKTFFKLRLFYFYIYRKSFIIYHFLSGTVEYNKIRPITIVAPACDYINCAITTIWHSTTLGKEEEKTAESNWTLP